MIWPILNSDSIFICPNQSANLIILFCALCQLQFDHDFQIINELSHTNKKLIEALITQTDINLNLSIIFEDKQRLFQFLQLIISLFINPFTDFILNTIYQQRWAHYFFDWIFLSIANIERLTLIVFHEFDFIFCWIFFIFISPVNLQLISSNI